MPTVKLNTHQRTHYQDDLVICQKDFPDFKIGDIVEIYSNEENFSRLILQITNVDKPKVNFPTITIEQSIAQTFQLRIFSDVIMNILDKNIVALDSVELFFKDQYLARSDMWRLKKHITNTSVYLNKKIEFSNIRCQVFEMWHHGIRWASGYINDETKVVFRSASSMVYLFLQMSSEMWDYDINGDLYFEKAVKGFLSDLFNKWKTFNCSHDVTIVMFSRTFYQASDINEFPESMRECLQQDYQGRFYEDYYRVAVQNERFDDWSPTLIYLRELFNLYEEEVIHYHEKRGLKGVKAYNSTASQGNFLEVLNMSLNVFERHNLDRSFDRTGQLSVVISPGVGVYEVDLDLTNITKQRIIDNGIGSDLVCLGEQPLHAVPLFKFNSRHSNMSNDQYNMPHWINLSFYSSKQRFPSSNFIPRIKMPNISPPEQDNNSMKISPLVNKKSSNLNLPPFIHNHRNSEISSTSGGIDLTSCQNIPFIDYDEYDNQIFRTSITNKHQQQSSSSVFMINQHGTFLHHNHHHHHHVPIHTQRMIMSYNRNSTDGNSLMIIDEQQRPKRRQSVVVPSRSAYSKLSLSQSPKNNDNGGDMIDNIGAAASSIDVLQQQRPKNNSFSHNLSTSVENKSNNDGYLKIKSKDDIIVHKFRDQLLSTKALINPFDPSHVTIKLNSNRRRWTHVFPLGPTGIFMQQHHYQAIPNQNNRMMNNTTINNNNNNTVNDDINNILYDSIELLSKDKNFKRKSFDQIDGGQSTKNINDKNIDLKKNLTKSRSNALIELVDKKSTPSIIANETTTTTDIHQKQRSLLLTDNSLLWAWGATGEQEWTPAITTGVDWKSLVMPACLPITTDFLPDKRTLEQEYVTHIYDLLPEEQANELYQQRFMKSIDNIDGYGGGGGGNSGSGGSGSGGNSNNHKKMNMLTIDQFYNELINQRLQQGFQIILLPTNEIRYTFASDRTGGNKFTFILSIGRIYHELAHKENRISIINYHPRHPYKANNIRYCYRIRTPDNETYGVSWVAFTSEKLENYKWNYLDNYICLRGASAEYPLIESLKYWRFRLLVLPTQHSKTKKIIDRYISGDNEFNCDLYDVFSFDEKIQLQKGFIKLLKVINGVKLISTNKSIENKNCQQQSLLTRRNSSTSIQTPPTSANSGDNPEASPLSLIDAPNYRQIKHEKLSSTNRLSNDSCQMDQYDSIPEQIPSKKISIKSLSNDIIDFMQQQSSNLFSIRFRNLPEYTFISLEAIEWAVKNIENISNETIAEQMFQNFLNNDLIRHASGDQTQTIFKRGFHLYCLMTEQNRQFFSKNQIDREYFERAWMEVGIVQQHNPKDVENSAASTSTTTFEEEQSIISNQTPEFTFKNFQIELDSKTDRVEWVNVKYHSLYDPEQAFEMIMEWMCATGNAIPEKVSQWSRTKGTNLHIVPIPWDPFALPFSNRSDPLRGPIYISLNLDCLLCFKIMEDDGGLFNFQEKILVKFGFIPFHDPTTENQRQFVHVSGSIFVMIPSKQSTQKNPNKRGKFLQCIDQEMGHEAYITRHFSGMQLKGQDAHIDTKIGFLWCWNYLITKRWKTNVTGDENSMRKIMQDFRGFCQNKDNRLVEFYNNVYHPKPMNT
ncbi:GATOR complex protein depdc5 [Dermatophagoides pteronyssinus]|uniref:GATOR complex protein depdc5 n=1 Tax=Dermatophagoides pteronyssinus TaxID=6956 RepID=A0ABQ8IX54_DERPT|nr:GATOR complex protein depdc5 [Dermatophagoides pteronyssinus]